MTKEDINQEMLVTKIIRGFVKQYGRSYTRQNFEELISSYDDNTKTQLRQKGL